MQLSNLDELLGLYDQHFIRGAYYAVLGRAPDPTGTEYYLRRLRAGAPKMQILAQLRKSSEGKGRALALPGLAAAIARYNRTRWPLIGRWFTTSEGVSAIEQKLRSIENQLFLIREENAQRVNPIEAVLKHEVPHLDANGSAWPFDSRELKQLSAEAMEIYRQLKSSKKDIRQ